MLKKLMLIICSFVFVFCANAEDEFFSEEFIQGSEIDMADQMSADAINNYQVDGSLFQKITALEQEKVVMQLEKERAQLNLELERLNAEKMKVQMEMGTLSGHAEQQQKELEMAKAQLEAQAEKLKRQQELIETEENEVVTNQKVAPKKEVSSFNAKYRLVNVIGVGNQLQATIEEIATKQNKRIAVGRQLDGYTVKSISLNDGIVFEKDGVSENLSIGK